MVEEFLPPQYHIPLTSRRLSMIKARYSRRYDTALEKTDECTKKNSENRPVADEVRRGFIELGAQKRERGKSTPEEGFSSSSEDLIKDKQELNQSKLHEQCEQQVEQGEYVEPYEDQSIDVKNGDEDQIIDVKDNILADSDETSSPRANGLSFWKF